MIEREEARALAEKLVARMTLEEKASQLRYDAPAIPRLGVPAYNWWNEALHGIARAGTATVFPQAIGLAAIFDEEFHQRVAQVIATEGRAKYNAQSSHGDRDIYKGLTMWSPNINIFRDPRWGRGHETYGEDPYLTARLGVQFIRGLQGEGKYLKLAACAKHFAVHSGPECLRHEFDARPTPKDLNETYLPAFEAAVTEGKVEAVMGAYNRVNGEPACGSTALLKDTLRGQWGFEGHIVSDCWAIRDFHEKHCVTATAPESAALAIENGCDVNCGNTYLHLLQAYQEGRVTEEQITLACTRLFTTRAMLGLLSDDCEYDQISFAENDTDEHAALAQEAAEKSMVLLHNDGILPLDEKNVRTVAVIGPNADSIPALEGNYNGISSRYVTMLEGIRAYCVPRGIRVLYSKGSALNRDIMGGISQPDDRLAEALACAELADVVIACVGLDASIEGEEDGSGPVYFSGDKTDLLLPACQRRLLEALTAAGKPLVTVVSAGSSLNVPKGNAQLLAWYAGQAGGTALANILFGRVNPSGKLPVTFYKDIAQLPDFEDYRMEGRTYRYFQGEVLYPFGHGLSYTTFACDQLTADDQTVSLRVANTGSREGETVVQVYVRAEESQWATPNPSLAGFGRVALKAGESKTVCIPLSRYAFTVVNDLGERIRDGKRFTLWAGFSQPDERSAALAGVQPIRTEMIVE